MRDAIDTALSAATDLTAVLLFAAALMAWVAIFSGA